MSAYVLDTASSLRAFQILSFTKPSILRFQQLYAQKLGVSKMDLRIAAVTLEHGGTVVTHNQSDFQRIPGLAVVDWSI